MNATLFKCGLTREEVMRGLGTEVHGVARLRPDAIVDQAKRTMILQLRASGMKIRSIATEVGCATGTVSHVLNGRGK